MRFRQKGCHTDNHEDFHPYAKIVQERRLKRLITLGGLEIGIQHQIVKALELSNPPTPPPPQKK